MSEHSDSVAQDPQTLADFPFATFAADTFGVVMQPIDQMFGTNGSFDSLSIESTIDDEPTTTTAHDVEDSVAVIEPAAEVPAVVEPPVVIEPAAVVEPTVVEPAVVESAVAEPVAVEVEPEAVESAVVETPVVEPLVADANEVDQPVAVDPPADRPTEIDDAVCDVAPAAVNEVSKPPVEHLGANILPGVTRFYGNVQVSKPQPSRPAKPIAVPAPTRVEAKSALIIEKAAESTVEPAASIPPAVEAPAVAEVKSEPTAAVVQEPTEVVATVEAVKETVIEVPATAPTNVAPIAETKTAVEAVAIEAVAIETLEEKSAEQEPALATGFRAMPLIEDVQVAIEFAGYKTPTPVQAEIIPHMLEGRDVLAQSQTGSGKTAAFALPILSTIDIRQRSPQVLVLVPTRELAMQVAASFSKYSREMRGFCVAPIYGGADYGAQFRQLKRGLHVVVGTPGRVIDHIKRGSLNLDEINCLVLDEADEMLNMGFLEDVQFVLDRAPDDRQIALFSATLPGPIRDISKRYLTDPARVTIKQQSMTADSIRQRALIVSQHEKIEVLARIVEAEETDGVIVFTKTKDATVSVAEKLNRLGLSAIALNGDMPQKVRERSIEQIKSGQFDILVATDVAARGLDVTRVSHVINYDMPNDGESYTHRVGRTGRAGRPGEAIIFVTGTQRGKLRFIEKVTKQPITVVEAPTATQINEIRAKRFQQRIAEAIASKDTSMFEEMITKFAEETETPMIKIAAALAEINQKGRPFLMQELRRKPKAFEGKPPRGDRERDGNGASRGGNDGKGYGQRVSERPATGGRSSGAEEGMDRYRIEVGKRDGVKPGNIVGAIANEGGIEGTYIGAIQIHDSHTTIDLPSGMPRTVLESLQETRVAGKPMQLKLAGAEREQSSYGSRPARSHTPRYSGGGGSGGPRGGAGPKKFNQSKSFHGGKRKKRRTDG